MSSQPTVYTSVDFDDRVRFVCALARRLHQYGTSAPRLESAVARVATRLGLACQVWSNPTGIIISFARCTEPEPCEEPLAEITQVIRLEPGDNDLRRLSEVDRIAEDVSAGRLGVADGTRELLALRPRGGPWRALGGGLAYGVAAGAIAALLRSSWAEVEVSAIAGAIVGLLGVAMRRRRGLSVGFEAVAALLASLVAMVWAASIAPLNTVSVIVASLIVLLPGLMLTTASNELANYHLVSGMSRFAGAGAILLKLAFGTAAGIQVAHVLGFVPMEAASNPVPEWAQWVALAVACANFAVLFKAKPSDAPLVFASALLGYAVTRVGGAAYGSEFGVFLAGFVVGVAANTYARWRNRPGALVRVPGIILAVPGSVGLRSLFFTFGGDASRGLEVAATLLLLLVSLVAGLMFANLVVAPRKTLS